MSNHNAYYAEIFDYLSAPETPSEKEPAVVFGRQDPFVAHKLGNLIIADMVDMAVITGGIGKDSGDLLKQGYSSEAAFLHKTLEIDSMERDYSLPPVVLDENAANGGENARNSMDILLSEKSDLSSVTAVTHATSLRRLAETLKFEGQKKTQENLTVHRVPSDYIFDPSNQKDQNEAAAELLRLADWPEKGMLGKQPDIPENLVDFARDTYGKAPKPVKPWQSSVLKYLPKGMQASVISFAARHNRK